MWIRVCALAIHLQHSDWRNKWLWRVMHLGSRLHEAPQRGFRRTESCVKVLNQGLEGRDARAGWAAENVFATWSCSFPFLGFSLLLDGKQCFPIERKTLGDTSRYSLMLCYSTLERVGMVEKGGKRLEEGTSPKPSFSWSGGKSSWQNRGVATSSAFWT